MTSDPSQNPLAAPTVQGRIRALYEARGFNRATFARALGVGYSVVANWESPTNPYSPSIPNLREAAVVLRVSTDDLIFGLEPRPQMLSPNIPTQGHGAGAYSIDLGTLRIALDRVGVSAAAREALVVHMESPRGQLQRVTVDYALAFAEAWDESRNGGADDTAATKAAVGAAINARAEASARVGAIRSTALNGVAPGTSLAPSQGFAGESRGVLPSIGSATRGKGDGPTQGKGKHRSRPLGKKRARPKLPRSL